MSAWGCREPVSVLATEFHLHLAATSPPRFPMLCPPPWPRGADVGLPCERCGKPKPKGGAARQADCWGSAVAREAEERALAEARQRAGRAGGQGRSRPPTPPPELGSAGQAGASKEHGGHRLVRDGDGRWRCELCGMTQEDTHKNRFKLERYACTGDAAARDRQRRAAEAAKAASATAARVARAAAAAGGVCCGGSRAGVACGTRALAAAWLPR